MSRHRFRPRFRAAAWTAVGLGGSVAIVSLSLGLVALPVITGGLGVVLGAGYLASPTWRLAVTVDAGGLEVGSPRRRRFRLAWPDVVRVIADLDHHTCFVDGGAPERSLLVPGEGAPAPYDLDDRPRLVAAIVDAVAAIAPDRVTRVASLEEARELLRAPPAAAPPP